MFIFEWAGGMVMFLAMAVLAIYFYGRNQRDIGYELGRDDRYTELAAERRTGRHTPRHAAGTAPRRHPDPAPAPDSPGQQPPWYTETPGPVQWPRGGAIATFLERKPATPGIDTILLDPQPAPRLNGADDTGTMPRVQLDLASTGELRAITSAWIAEHCPGAEEAEAIA
jgi:hypothetical protein